MQGPLPNAMAIFRAEKFYCNNIGITTAALPLRVVYFAHALSKTYINEKCSNPSSGSLCRIEGAKSVDDTDVDGGRDRGRPEGRGGGGVDEAE